MGTPNEYRLTRSIEASLIDQIKDRMASDAWKISPEKGGIRIEKAFARVYDGKPPCLLIEVTTRPIKTREVGSDKIFKDAEITVRFFADNDGQREDFTDWLTTEFQSLWDYFTYFIQDGQVINKEKTGTMRLTVSQNKKEYLNTWAPENMEQLDRYRQLMIIKCRVTLEGK